jgi:hypothetical protein
MYCRTEWSFAGETSAEVLNDTELELGFLPFERRIVKNTKTVIHWTTKYLLSRGLGNRLTQVSFHMSVSY